MPPGENLLGPRWRLHQPPLAASVASTAGVDSDALCDLSFVASVVNTAAHTELPFRAAGDAIEANLQTQNYRGLAVSIKTVVCRGVSVVVEFLGLNTRGEG